MFVNEPWTSNKVTKKYDTLNMLGITWLTFLRGGGQSSYPPRNKIPRDLSEFSFEIIYWIFYFYDVIYLNALYRQESQ